jgi:hypothetical protein
MVLILLSIVVAAIAVAISVTRRHSSVGSLIRSGIAKENFSIVREVAEQPAIAGPTKPFLVVVLPDGKIVTPRVAAQV